MKTIIAKNLHPSSALSLQALNELAGRQAVQKVLDIGCGDGILSLAAHSLFKASVLAVDISETAVADCTRNMAAFAPSAPITVLRSHFLDHPNIKANAPYDLIIGNLLAEWLFNLGQDVQKLLAPQAYCIFSGILAWQYETLAASWKSLNFELIQEFSHLEWRAVLLSYNRHL